MPARAPPHAAAARGLRARRFARRRCWRGDDTLAVFGVRQRRAASSDDPRYLRVPLQPHGAAPFEVWRAQRAGAAAAATGDIAWATDGELLFGAIEIDESTTAGIGSGELPRAPTRS